MTRATPTFLELHSDIMAEEGEQLFLEGGRRDDESVLTLKLVKQGKEFTPHLNNNTKELTDP